MPPRNSQQNRTGSVSSLLVESLEAGLANDSRRLELLALTATRRLRSEDPDLSDKLASVLGKFATNASSLRWAAGNPPPFDSDEGTQTIKVSVRGEC